MDEDDIKGTLAAVLKNTADIKQTLFRIGGQLEAMAVIRACDHTRTMGILEDHTLLLNQLIDLTMSDAEARIVAALAKDPHFTSVAQPDAGLPPSRS
jgi:hypothetical protein